MKAVRNWNFKDPVFVWEEIGDEAKWMNKCRSSIMQGNKPQVVDLNRMKSKQQIARDMQEREREREREADSRDNSRTKNTNHKAK